MNFHDEHEDVARHQDDDHEDESDDDDDDIVEDLPPPPARYLQAGPRQSVSAESHGAWNKLKDFVPPVFPKSDEQKERLRTALMQSFIFQNMEMGSVEMVLDAMSEKRAEAGTLLVEQGADGLLIWIIEEGMLECFKKDKGTPEEDKGELVKTYQNGDILGELALLHNSPHLASVYVKDPCVLWELDRETFNAICREQADRSLFGGC